MGVGFAPALAFDCGSKKKVISTLRDSVLFLIIIEFLTCFQHVFNISLLTFFVDNFCLFAK